MNDNLKQLQNTILEIMIEIKRICEENQITYFLDGGTCLGAIRHSGFIPWDDDADISMLREDYERFIKLCLNEHALNPAYELQCNDTDNHYSDGFVRVRKNNTLCVIDYHNERGYKNLGIFVDIFPIDFSYTNKERVLKKHKTQIDTISRKIINKLTPKHKTLKSKILYAFLLLTSVDNLFKKRTKLEKELSIGDIKYAVHTYSSYSLKKAIFPVELFLSPSIVKFEGQKFTTVSDPDLYLKIVYGNYKKLPDKDKRVAHLPSLIKF